MAPPPPPSPENSAALLFAISGAFVLPGCGDKDEGDPIENACAAYANTYLACYPEYGGYRDMLEQYCESILGAYVSQYGEACEAAFEDYFVCLSKLSCEQLEAEGDVLCDADAGAFMAACGGEAQTNIAQRAIRAAQAQSSADSETGGMSLLDR